MKNKMEEIDLIIPTLNEEEGIGETIEKFPTEELESMGYDVLFTIVDGGSEDKTQEIARSKGADVIVQERSGYGRAYKTGFKQSEADIIITADADATYGFKMVPEMVRKLEGSYDFVNTNRLVKVPLDTMSFRNKFGNKVLAFFMRLLFWTPYHDSQSGMWAFKREILDDLKLTSDGMPFSEEIKVEAYRRGFEVTEINISYTKREGERKLHPWRDGPKNLTFLFEKRLNYFKEILF